MKIKIISLIIILTALFAIYTFTKEDVEPVYNLKTMDFRAFDQTMGEGWRYYDDRKQYIKAAKLIEDYIAVNPKAKRYLHILNFHAGQMYGYANNYPKAIEKFNISFAPKSKNPEMQVYNKQWDLYVSGTIAFLSKDKAALQQVYDDLIKSLENPSSDLNSQVLKRMIDGFDKTYQDVY